MVFVICIRKSSWAYLPIRPHSEEHEEADRDMEYDGGGKTSRQTATCIQICDLSCCVPVAALAEQTDWLRNQLGGILTGSSWGPASPGRTERKKPVDREKTSKKTLNLSTVLTLFGFYRYKLLPTCFCPPLLHVHWHPDFLLSPYPILHFILPPASCYPFYYSSTWTHSLHLLFLLYIY